MIVTLLASVQAARRGPSFRAAVPRTDETVRVTDSPEVVEACLLAGKPLFELQRVLRVFHDNAGILYVVATRVKCIALLQDSGRESVDKPLSQTYTHTPAGRIPPVESQMEHLG